VPGRVRGVGSGASWNIYFPETPEVARQRRRARYERDTHFEERVAAVAEATLRRVLAERDQEQGHPPLHHGTPPLHHGTPPLQHGTPPLQHGTPPLHHGTPPLHHGTPPLQHGTPPLQHGTPPLHHGTQTLPFHSVGWSSSASVLGIAPGPPNPIDDITVSIVETQPIVAVRLSFIVRSLTSTMNLLYICFAGHHSVPTHGPDARQHGDGCTWASVPKNSTEQNALCGFTSRHGEGGCVKGARSLR
jgi:hypothetical protein